MEAGRQNMEELQAESSWMPKTPFKNVLERPPVFWPSSIQQGQKPDQVICDLESAYGTTISLTRGSAGACTVSTMEEASRFNVPFKTLIAMAEARSGSGNGATIVRTQLLNSNPSNSQETNYDPRPGYDLNLSHESLAEAFYRNFTCELAPVTPEKPVMRDQSEVARRKNLCMNERPNEALNQQENKSVAAEVLVNELQSDKLSQNSATDSNLAAISPPSENQNPIKEGGDEVNLIKTPQQKPKRKKHRPKVITEGKARPRKQEVTKPVDSKENPTGKRKYVRKNAPNRTATTPIVEVTGEPTNQTVLEPAKKSCRRTLNFDIEEPKDDTINCMPRTEQEPQDNAGGNQSKSTVHLGQGIEVIVNNTQCGIAYEFNYPVSQLLRDYSSLTENQVAGTQKKVADIPPEQGHVYTYKAKDLLNVPSEEHLMHIKSQTHSKLRPSLPKGFNCCTGATIRTEQAAKDPKRTYIASTQQSNICSTNSVGTSYNSLFVYNNGECWGQFQKRKRTEKGQCATSTTAASFGQRQQHAVKPDTAPDGKIPNGGHSKLNESCAISLPSWKEKSTRQKPRGRHTCVQNLVSMADSAWCNTSATHPAGKLAEYCNSEQVGNSHGHQPIVRDLAELMRYTFTKKKRTKNQGSLVNFAPSCRTKEQPSGNILYKQDNFSAKTSGTHVQAARKTLSVNDLAEQSVRLEIIRRTIDNDYTEQNALVPYNFGNEQNALVLYRQEGTVVPYYGTFAHIKKRPRAKVDLDDETNRVWKLLMGNINSKGIDGTDPETAKQWEEDRSVFHGRAKSFIARMHLVQGDRRFSPWKGSVVDSVIGVFLTQNVSDHLSSSAFMSLAAHFPANSNRKFKPRYGGDPSSVVGKPVLCIVDPETIKSNELSNHSVCDQSSMTLHDTEFDEEKESVNGEEMSGSSTGIINSQSGLETSDESVKNISNMEVKEVGHTYYEIARKGASDISSCQNSVVSFQNSIDTPISLASEREESFSENNLQTMDMIGGHIKGSFLELLQKAESTTLRDYGMGNGNFSSSLKFKNQCNYTQNIENDLQRQQLETLDHLRSSSEGSTIPFIGCHVPSSTFGVNETEDVQITKEARYVRISEDKGTNVMKDYTASTEESANQFLYHDKLNITVHEAPKSPFGHDPSIKRALKGNHITMEAGASQMEDPKILPESLSQAQSNEMPQNVLFSNQALDIMESSSEFNEQGRNQSNTTESNWIKSSQSKGKELQDMDTAKRKAKIRRVGNDIRDNFDWDALRIEAEAKQGKRERTVDTVDSVDWEAVRCANVNEIAETIKERGMNNILAGRIKEFLERMVREHGSIDLEWLRDIPPDTAKEYLLTVRGLGLKSVECVRLLTLHHLAFPVDTNVARIAVRLGWVPLQPLPESLQLHLLEMYPVMESIQKYLWPRLCKLDQKTLYEFHYQLITFGKVFCTKGKPNCNACPMRGECRHFASAFASARLSLPAPEEKGIVRTTENRREQYPPMMVNQLSLPPPVETRDNEKSEANQQLDIQFGVSNCKPIIEEPSSPEPEHTPAINDIEDFFLDDPDEIPTIKLNIEEFTQNLQNYMQENMELQEGDMSKALVALTAQAASIPTPKLKNVSRLRTEHHVYELPDSHPLLQELDRREVDDPSPYLLAIWTPGETADSVQTPKGSCCAQEYGKLCDEKTCYSCNSTREANFQIVRGTLLVPCRTAMRGSFPLNGTYFQVNEVFADHDSSMNPIDVPRSWIWNLPRRTVYFGTSVPSIFRGLTTEEIQHCFWRGYVCVRGFDQKTRAPRPLMARLHFPVSKLPKNKEKNASNHQKT